MCLSPAGGVGWPGASSTSYDRAHKRIGEHGQEPERQGSIVPAFSRWWRSGEGHGEHCELPR